MRNHLIHFFTCTLFILSSCSGGGSGGSDGSSSGRTNKTGVRVVNASIDSVPLGIFQNELFLSKTNYLEQSEFIPITVASSILKVTRGTRANEVIRQLNFQPSSDLEYTVLVLGEGDDNALDIELVSEPILRPKSGLGRVTFVNALIGANNAKCTISDATSQNTLQSAYGVLSNSIEVASGIKTFTVESSSGNREVATLNLEDRGELLIILAGKTELGFSTLKAITDLD